MSDSESSFFYARGKLLLSGEYFVLDGAKAIGMPTKFGQSLKVISDQTIDYLSWKSMTNEGKCWFEGSFKLSDFTIINCNDQATGKALANILVQTRKLNPEFLINNAGFKVESRLEFPRLWGLGSSSTLLYNIAQWSGVDAFELSANTFGGSGYDIACAGVDNAILYQLEKRRPSFKEISFNPIFRDQLYFVYLSKKQNSRSGIKRYREKAKDIKQSITEISQLAAALLEATNLRDFQNAIRAHEEIVSRTIELPKVQDLYFADFAGTVKSLGAWGGDFVLVATEMEESYVKSYFNKKGFDVFLKYEEMVYTEAKSAS